MLLLPTTRATFWNVGVLSMVDTGEHALITDRLLKSLRTCECRDGYFPPTEVFNEGWMLRLVIDAVQSLNLSGSPLLPAASWEYCRL